jgi:predicted RNA binding protein YcfA (HicA-like mRNA interferase family)
MSPGLRNIPLRRYRQFLTKAGCKCVRTKGGHEHWTRADLNRAITLQSHIDPVPEFIVRQHLRYLGLDREEFEGMLKG